jgi:hypothetical protein
MSIKNLATAWSLPDRTQDRQQVTLRIPYDIYAKLHALKEVYNQRPVNDMITDILRAGLDEIIEALPSYKIDPVEAIEMSHHFGGKPEDYADDLTGPRVKFDQSYRRLLEKNPADETQEEAA